MILILKNYSFDSDENRTQKKLVSNNMKRVFYNNSINDYLLLSLILAFLPVSCLK